MKNLSKIREKLYFDVLIVGAGIGGLSTGIRLKQLVPELEVCILEKSLNVGDHIVSGCAFNPRALFELLPNWENMGSPITTKIVNAKNMFLTEKRAFNLPDFLAPWNKYKGEYIVSLGNCCRWLKNIAEEHGVRVYEGFTAKEMLIHPSGYLEGIATGPIGLSRDYEKESGFQESVEIIAKQTVLAEGANGLLTKQLIKKYKLIGLNYVEYESLEPDFSLGIKELWKVENHVPGQALTTYYWPLMNERGNGFLYTCDEFVHIGLILGMDYVNPHLDIYEELQRYKTHPHISAFLKNGKCLEFGAKVLDDGGYFSVPKLSFPGGLIIGAGASMSVPITSQGAHTAMKSGMLAAEAIHSKLLKEDIVGKDITEYYDLYKNSWIYYELFKYRHLRQYFNKSPFYGFFFNFFSKDRSQKSTFLVENYRLGENRSPSNVTEFTKNSKPINYPSKPSSLSFEKKTSSEKSNILFKDQPEFIKIKSSQLKDQIISIRSYGKLEEKICPTGVFKYEGNHLKIDSSKCIQCGACDLKSTKNMIEITLPESGTGPK